MRAVFLLAFLLLPAWAAAQGVLVIESAPANAFVTVDGLPRGQTPAVLQVPAGTREVRVRAVGHRAQTFTREVADGDTVYVRAALDLLRGVVLVEGLPAGARARVADKDAVGPVDAPPGDADVVVEVPGARPLRLRVYVQPDVESRVAYVPRRLSPPAVLLAAVVPGGAHFADGRAGRGRLVAGGALAALGGAALMGGAVRQADRDLEAALAVYGEAPTERAAAEARLGVERAHGRTHATRIGQRALLAAALAVHTAGFADALARHVYRPALVRRGTRPLSETILGPALGPDGAALHLRVRF